MKSIGTKISTGYGVALLLLLGIGIIATNGLYSISRSVQWVDHSNEVLKNLLLVDAALINAETGQRGFVITGRERYMEAYNLGLRGLPEHLESIRELTGDNPQQQKRLDSLNSLIKAKLAELQETIELRKTKGFEAAQAVVQEDRGKDIMNSIRQEEN